MKTNILKAWRQENGVTQTELARRIGCSQPLIVHYENVGLPERVSSLRKIARATGLDMIELLEAV